jgi:hypothetical protein
MAKATSRKKGMAKRRAFPFGKPLPRLAQSSLIPRALRYFVHEYPGRIGEPNAPQTPEARRRYIASRWCDKRGNGKSAKYLEQVERGEVGLKPPNVWTLGWAVHDAGVEWMSGPLALTLTPRFEPHLLGTIAELLAPGPTPQIRKWWPTLRSLAHRQCPEDWADFAAARQDVMIDDFELRVDWIKSISIDDYELRSAFEGAWDSWWGREDFTRFPSPFITLMALHLAGQSLMNAKRPVSGGGAARRPKARLHSEVILAANRSLNSWLADVPSVWDNLGPYMKKFDSPMPAHQYLERLASKIEAKIEEPFRTVPPYVAERLSFITTPFCPPVGKLVE